MKRTLGYMEKKPRYLKKRKFSEEEKKQFQKRKICYLYVFRHGVTYFNKKDMFSGWMDSNLTKEGKRDAKKIAKQLKNKKIEIAYTSHLQRARDTLKPVLETHPEIKEIILDDRIIERKYGTLQGMTHQDFIEREGAEDYKILLHLHKIDHLKGKILKDFIQKVGEAEFKVIHRTYDIAPPKGESFRQVEKRVLAFLKELIARIKKDKVNIAISCHGNSMRPLRRYFEKMSKEKMSTIENPWDRAFIYRIKV